MKPRESPWARLVERAGAEGSTVPMALIRIGLALLLWARWGEDMVLVQAEGPATPVSTTPDRTCLWGQG